MTSALLLVALSLQVKVGVEAKRDSTDSTHRAAPVASGGSARRAPKRIPVTAAHLRTAFASPAARELLLRARAARLAQDSALMSYEATGYLRISAGLGFSRIGRDRLIFRHENATHVRWHRKYGAWVDVKGARTHLPADVDEDDGDFGVDAESLPYYPGQEPLLSFNGSGSAVKTQVDERDMVHPLLEGAEAYYTYRLGDSVTFRLPDGHTVRLRELDVRPRESKWNVAIGSLWFDVSTGQLVRAAYRLAVPMDIWAIVKEEEPKDYEEIPIWVRPLISPMRAQVSAIAVEYSLHQGRFWLPRLRTAEGSAQVSFMRVPFKFEQSFKYQSVNAIDSLPTIVAASERDEAGLDTLSEEARDKWRDSVREQRRARVVAERDSVRKGLKAPTPKCDSTGTRLVTRRHRIGEQDLRMAVRISCDLEALAHSPDLPKSIYDEGEEIFGSADRDALVKEALSLVAQPPLAIGGIRPTLHWGLEFTRFNRIEGLSSGVLVEQPLGGGYTASLLARIGHADLEPNGELTLSRSNLSRVVRGRVYHRMVSASDWGSPLSFGSSLSSLLFGRDEGFYYRGTGAELESAAENRETWNWRLFAERQRSAVPENGFTLGARFIPNIVAREGAYAGFSARLRHTRGLDPNGFRVFTDARVESAFDDSSNVYGRGALDLTFTQRLGRVVSALTLSGGSSAGELPPQRRWYLGGAQTVRGQWADTAHSGNAYWMGRFEAGGTMRAVRPVVFGDIGWVGQRDQWRAVGRPLSGVGVGASVLDGLIRLDLSRGLYPARRVRLDLYVEARF